MQKPRPPCIDFWYMTVSADEEWEDEDIRDAWPKERRQDSYYTIRDMVEHAAALEVDEDGDEVIVIVATKEDGSDARRYKVCCSVQIDYDVDDDGFVDMTPELVSFTDSEEDEDEDAPEAEKVKGAEDDATLPLFD